MRTYGRPRGKFYAYTLTPNDRGSKTARQVAWQAPTAEAAAKALEATGLPGYVEGWSDREQRRYEVARLSDGGEWTSRNPFTGEVTPVSAPWPHRKEADRG